MTSHFKISRKKPTTYLNPTWAYRHLKQTRNCWSRCKPPRGGRWAAKTSDTASREARSTETASSRIMARKLWTKCSDKSDSARQRCRGSRIEGVVGSTKSPAAEIESISFPTQQRKDSQFTPLILFIEKKLPDDAKLTNKTAAQATQFATMDRVLYFLDPCWNHKKRVVVPKHLQEQLIQEHHRGNMGGHSAANNPIGC